MKKALPQRIILKSHLKNKVGSWSFRSFMSFAFLVILWLHMSPPQVNAQELNDDGNEHTIDAPTGTNQDLTIPNNPLIKAIRLKLRGGDGGNAIVDGNLARGGEGAFMTVEFKVGVGSDKIPAGSTLRFMEGRRGQSGSSGTAGSGLEYGGGGGGTGVIFKNDGSAWTMLAVAGGGGGALKSMVLGADVVHLNGEGGRAVSIGSSGGSGSEFGGGGGGIINAGGGWTCVDINTAQTFTVGGGGAGGVSVGPGGHSQNCVTLFTVRDGGMGFGGGGAGKAAGGGGGGFSGGAGGGENGRGGGGGSYYNNFLLYSLALADNGGTTNIPADGEISYQFLLNQAPTVTCKPAMIYLDESGAVTLQASDVDDGSIDADGSIVSRTVSPSFFDCSGVGTHTVTLTVIDDEGAISTCTTTVTIVDDIPPSVTCRDNTVELDGEGNVSITHNTILNRVSDACGIFSMELDRTSFTCADVGDNIAKLMVTDVNGNVGTCTATVTVDDIIPPTVVTKNISVTLNDYGNASIVAADVDNGSWDGCGIDTLYLDIYDFNCADVGVKPVLLTVVDVNANPASMTAFVTVLDITKPVVKTEDVTVVLDRNGRASVVFSDIDAGSRDNCSILDKWLEGLTEYDCGDVGTHQVTLFAKDPSGNVGQQVAEVSVEFHESDLTNIHGVSHGDTVRLVDSVPWPIDSKDLLNHRDIRKHGTIETVHKEALPVNAPWSMYDLRRYEYRIKNGCGHSRRLTFYVALYDLAPPGFHSFPNDTIVDDLGDVPAIDRGVRIIDICQYVAWDTVITFPFLDGSMKDTLGFTRRWIARDPVGHESFRDQMIWLRSGHRNQYGLITGRIADEDHILRARFAGEAGTNGLPVSLYRIDESTDSLVWVDNWTTGDWQGAQGKYYFVLQHSGSYRVKIDTAICLLDTLKFDQYLWSDTLELSGGEVIDQGWIITLPCAPADSVNENAISDKISVHHDPSPPVDQEESSSRRVAIRQWTIYPNPAKGYLQIDIQVDTPVDYRMYDALGRVVKTGQYHRGQTLGIEDLKSGVYLFYLANENEFMGVRKILIVD